MNIIVVLEISESDASVCRGLHVLVFDLGVWWVRDHCFILTALVDEGCKSAGP